MRRRARCTSQRPRVAMVRARSDSLGVCRSLIERRAPARARDLRSTSTDAATATC
jgi:hypothetical protein